MASCYKDQYTIIKIIVMENLYVENRIVDLPLPQILTSFTFKVCNQIVPTLNNLIAQLESNHNNNLLLNIISFVFFVYLMKSITTNLFVYRAPPIKECSQQEVDSELSLFSSEIENLKNSLKKVIQKINLGQTGNHKNSFEKQDLVKLMSSYKKTVDDFNSLANFIIDSQQTVFQELKSFKKIHKMSKITMSTSGNKDLESSTHHETNDSETQEPSEQLRIQPTKASIPAPKKIRPPAPGMKRCPVPVPSGGR